MMARSISYLRVIDLDPYFAPAHMYLGMAYIQKRPCRRSHRRAQKIAATR